MSFTDGFQAGMMARKQREERKIRAEKLSEENKAIAARTKAIETLAPMVAEAAGISPEMVDQYLAPDPGESPRQRYERLSEVYNQLNFANTLRDQNQKRAQQQQALQMQQAQLEQMARKQAEQKRINTYADTQNMLGAVAQGSFAGGLNPEAAATAEAFARGPIGQMRRQGADITPQMLDAYTRAGTGNDRLGEVTYVEGEPFVRTNKNQITQLKKNGAAGKISSIEVGGKKYTIGPGNKYFDEEGNPVDFGKGDKPMTPLEFILSQSAGDAYQQYLREFEEKKKSQKASAADNSESAGAPARQPPAAAIDMLRKDPQLASQFDAKYGKGSARRYLSE